MSDFIRFSHHPMHMEAVQALLEGKRIARSLESTVDSLIPLISNEETTKQLEEIREAAARAGHVLQRLYNKNAKEAFGESQRDQGSTGRDSTTRTRRGDVSERPETSTTETRRAQADGE